MNLVLVSDGWIDPGDVSFVLRLRADSGSRVFLRGREEPITIETETPDEVVHALRQGGSHD